MPPVFRAARRSLRCFVQNQLAWEELWDRQLEGSDGSSDVGAPAKVAASVYSAFPAKLHKWLQIQPLIAGELSATRSPVGGRNSE